MLGAEWVAVGSVIPCGSCRGLIRQTEGRGGRRRYCSTRCRRAVENDRRRARRAAAYASQPDAFTEAVVYGPADDGDQT